MRVPFLVTLIVLLATHTAYAQTRVTFKSAKSASSYYQMAVQYAEAVKASTDGTVQITVEESQGSVQNVKEAPRRGAGYVFTTPPSLLTKATAGDDPFANDGDFASIRALFPMPSLTMHFVVRADSGVKRFADLAGKDFITGKGSFGARKAAEAFSAFGLDGQVNIIDVELNAAVAALKDRKVDGFATAGSYPAPNVAEAAASIAINLLSMDANQLSQIGGTPLEIPANTYSGVNTPTMTLSLPVGAYTDASTDEATAYALTKALWEQRETMSAANPWWSGVTTPMIEQLGAPLHKGALRYYEEAGIDIPDALRD